tara:strand:+ start:13661 stop:16186 length:2526 start_codon:yes stop_codon:yes gene_type:complete
MANIRTIDYGGFDHATGSAATGSGFMIWSGSMQISKSLAYASQKTQYYGVGIEAIAHSGSYLRFQTDTDGNQTSSLDIKTDKFFLGSDAAFISGSGDGTLAISSSNFELNEAGEVVMQGQITATAGGTIGGFAIGSDNLTATNFILNTADKRLTLGSGNTIFIADADDGIQLGHATFGSAPFSVTKAGALKATSGELAGWTLASDKLTGGNLIINKEGSIQSSDYISSLSGFTLSAASGGFLEVENARIRGTLSTAVFEKETVNAVGGQLYVANSTALTGSVITGQTSQGGEYTLTDTTMSVVNVSGFTQGEILSMKKMSSTGFATEYVFVNSSSRQNASSEINFAGNLMVTRGYGTGTTVTSVSQSLGEAPGSAQSYSGSQVIVSTGKVGTGYIRLNANPNDQTTPYMDIVERTGTGIYDLSLKTRLGDLSGINDTSFTDGVTGFGIYTGNGYFKGKVEITDPTGETMLENFGGVSGSIVAATKLVPDGEVSGSQWYQTLTTRHQVKNGVLMVSSSNNTSWNGELRSKQRFHRSDDHSLVFDVVPRDITGDASAPRMMIGWGAVISASTNSQPDSSYKNTAHALYFTTNDISIFQGSASMGAVSTNSVAAGSKYRCIITPLNDTNKSARYQIFKYPNLSGSVGDVTVAGAPHTQDHDDLDVGIFALKNTNTMEISNIQVTAPGQKSTVIDGSTVTTGQIVSTNWAAGSGSNIDLDAGTVTLGGYSNPGFQVSNTGFVAATNFSEKIVTVTAANSGSYFADNGNTGVDLVFDGSAGGDIVMNMQLNVAPYNVGQQAIKPIFDIVLPLQAAGQLASAQIIINTADVLFDNDEVAPSLADMTK